MKKLILAIGLSANLLLALACSSTGTANKTTTTTNNTSNRTTPQAAGANTTTTSTTSTTSTNTSSAAAPTEEGKQDFTLVNATGVEIDKLYVSPHDKDDWEEDILGRDTLPTGESVNIKFHRDEKAAMWDLRVEDKQGSSIEWQNLNLLEISKVTLHYDNNKATAETE
jgi:hypothetical protein